MTHNPQNNPMGSDLTKPDVAVERLEAWFSNLEDIYPDDVRAALDAIKTQAAEIERLREGVSEVIDAADPVVAAIKKIHPNDQGLDVMRLVNAISHLKALKGGAA